MNRSTMNNNDTPTPGAVKAAEEFLSALSIALQYPCDRQVTPLAETIDRLAVQSAVAEAKASGYAKGFDDCRKEQGKVVESLRSQIHNWEEGGGVQSERADKAEARVKELEAERDRYHAGALKCIMQNNDETAALRASNAELVGLLQRMLDVAENCDETGYATDCGFVDVGKLYEDARAALAKHGGIK